MKRFLCVICIGVMGALTITAQESRLKIGGYGEAVMTRNFYSDHFNRYKYPELYADTVSNGRFDLPHVVINMGYDFGRGWKMGMEIEFEHGGTESAVEVDDDESGEYEAENEKTLTEGGVPAMAKPLVQGITKAALSNPSWLAAASFQETPRVLTDASIKGKVDHLDSLKENLMVGKTIPVGTGYKDTRNIIPVLKEDENQSLEGMDEATSKLFEEFEEE